MKEFFRSIQDKLAHLGAGCIITFFLTWLLSTYISTEISIALGFIATIFVGIAKEFWDEKQLKGSFDIWDIVATVLGAVCIIGTYQLSVG